MSAMDNPPIGRNIRDTRDNAHGGGIRPRASLAVRITLVVLAVVALCMAAVTGWNLLAVTRFNQATAALNLNLASASKEDADLDALSAAQQQTDAQFQNAGTFGFLLPPQLRQSIETNAEVSRQLSERTRQQIVEQKGLAQSNGEQTTSDNTENADAKSGGALSDEQKKQVEDLLKANQQSTPSDSTEQNDENNSDTKNNQTPKPW